MKIKPKIAVIGAKGFPAWGGAARSSEAIFTRLKDRYDVTVYAISSHANEENYFGIRQIIFAAYKSKKFSVFIYYFKSLLHSLFKSNYDLVHVNHGAAGFIVPFLRLKYPVIMNVHGLPYDKDNKWSLIENKLINFFQILGYKYSNKIITVQKSSISLLEKYNSDNVFFIQNGVDNNHCIYPNDSSFDCDIVFSAARITYLKGLHLILSALNESQFKENVKIIGDLDQVSDYKKLCHQLSHSLNCRFLGLIKHKETLFSEIQKSKIFIFPSYSEGMSNMLLEVASLKIPIIASNIPQNTDIFNDNEMLFFRSGDQDDLGQKIHWALNNYEKFLEMAELAYIRTIRDHDWDVISKKYSDVYESLL